MDIDIKYDSSTLKNYKLVQPGDFIISLRSFQGGFETSYLTGITSPAYTIFNFIDNQSQNHMFWQYLFKRKNFINSLKKVTFGIRDGKAISFSQFGDVKVEYPDFDEQKHIAITLNKIDDTIQLHERKCEELTLIKKSLLQKLFPKEDKIKPEIRYKNFSDAWEQRKLGDISKTKRGLTYKPSNIDNTGIRVLRSSNIKEDTFVISDNDVFVKESAVNIPFVKNGDILITAANGSTNLVGKHAIIRDIPKNSAVHGGFMLITTSKEYEFLNASMSSNWYKKFIKKYVAGGNGAIGNLRKNDLDNQKIYVPKKDEQEKIGNFFKMLDSLITLHQRKLEKLKQLKKFLLQNMFI
ncbi:restriction endonuclease subunit S [Ligilactobacillus salivarius]|uniref:restriction endonuclease subunit S n=1 Tax=Ligilactobacillus salivarius TaxID=1624 RepID=UPI001875CDF5|nr:restriction endonuclease subunit S [Ligilactobacillus salivarius]MBE5066405.1 restriction endonuclease subunit S [Ligilactobacillus salivarius]